MNVPVMNTSAHPLPQYQTAQAAAMDLLAVLDSPVILGSLERATIPTGIHIALPAGHEAQVRPRSGLAAKHGISIVNAPGTIDPDYRGEIKVVLVNLSNAPYTINDGDRIAQLVIAPIERVTWRPVAELDQTERGHGGFGHTGT